MLALPAVAQTNIDLGGVNADPDAPVEVTADSLNVDQDTGSAVFTGNVVIGQGDLRLSAPEVRVTYGADTGDITRLQASGGVTFATATEAAEAQEADYDLAGGQLTLTGEVLLTQGQSALSADSMVLDLTSGTAQMSGRVRTVFQQDGNN
ncbi:lipopolysaccharide transport periplasmic protein LptA [Loktanella sp. DJP18]|uniref:lipopolysaccharide transport periplasmic protein LptA n=1 Tax=Loktanella sp. DJP18 TaxID=3409788 RepID=UPI003BB4C4D5